MKTIVITGASRGIGKALAEHFLGAGDFVIGTSRSGKADYSHENFVMIPLELGDAQSRTDCATRLRKLGKKIDILVNNAGMWHEDDDGPVVDTEALRQTLEIDLIGPVDLTEKLVSLMAPQGHIINISSRRGSCGYTQEGNGQPGSSLRHPAYSIAKTGLNMFTRKLAARLKGKVAVSSVHPGSVRTEMNPEGLLSPEEGAEDIYTLASSNVETGQFWFKGEKFPW